MASEFLLFFVAGLNHEFKWARYYTDTLHFNITGMRVTSTF